MEFGLFVQAHVPKHEVEADPVNAEHTRLMRELELAVACDRAGWKYVWSVEHHFLEEYSHISASEIFLPYVAGADRRGSTSARRSTTSRRRSITRPASPSGWRCSIT
jgi:hypothetical protein